MSLVGLQAKLGQNSQNTICNKSSEIGLTLRKSEGHAQIQHLKIAWCTKDTGQCKGDTQAHLDHETGVELNTEQCGIKQTNIYVRNGGGYTRIANLMVYKQKC